MKKIFRTATVPLSLNVLLKGQLKFLSESYELTAVSGPGADLDTVARREGVNVHPIEIERQISPLKDLVSLTKLYLYFKREKPDLVHSITPKAGLLSMMAAKAAGVPVRMHTFTGLIFPSKSGVMKKVLIAMDRVLCSCATHICPEGNGVKNDLIKHKITNKPLKIIANGNVNGIDPYFFSREQVTSDETGRLRQQLGILEGDFVFVFVGRLVKDKGINELVSAFTGLKNPANRLKLLLVGPFENELDPLQPKTLAEIESNPNIISVGFQQDVRPYLAVSDALAFPSYREGFPNVVMQAGAMELPSVVTDINGSNEIIIHGENGLIIPSKNTSSLQRAMQEISENNNLYQHLKCNARNMIINRYDNRVVWQALKEEYERNLSGK